MTHVVFGMMDPHWAYPAIWQFYRRTKDDVMTHLEQNENIRSGCEKVT